MQSSGGGPETVTMQEMVYSNMLTLNALVELLDERGVVPKADVLARIKKLQTDMQGKGQTQ
jgi:hypothetical protein